MRRRPPDDGEADPVRLGVADLAGTPSRRRQSPTWTIPLVVGLLLGACAALIVNRATSTTSPTVPTSRSAASALTTAEVKRIAAVAAQIENQQAGTCDSRGASKLQKAIAHCPGADPRFERKDIPCMFLPEGCPSTPVGDR